VFTTGETSRMQMVHLNCLAMCRTNCTVRLSFYSLAASRSFLGIFPTLQICPPQHSIAMSGSRKRLRAGQSSSVAPSLAEQAPEVQIHVKMRFGKTLTLNASPGATTLVCKRGEFHENYHFMQFTVYGTSFPLRTSSG
jgi:hypothetical protein